MKIGYFPYVTATVFSLGFTIFGTRYIPAAFFRDSSYITDRINSSVTGLSDSFELTANLYRLVNLDQISTFGRIIQWLIFFACIQVAFSLCQYKLNRLGPAIVASVYLILIPFYGAVFTKELIIALGILIYLIAIKILMNRRGFQLINNTFSSIVPILILSMIFAFTIRRYYFITSLLIVFYFFLNRFRFSIVTRITIPVLLISVASTVEYYVNLGLSVLRIDIFNIRINILDQLRIPANSSIKQEPITGSIVDNLLNFSEVWFQFIFPLNLIKLDFYYLGVFTVSFVTFMMVVLPYVSKRTSVHAHSIFLYAYFTTALIFEPDLGSFTRHTFVLIPLLLLVNSPMVTSHAMSKHRFVLPSRLN